ncbi:hypothetical protein SAMN05216360_105147 [Methylobacterium phyllostachyos]|uniref:Secreted protein n=1 Tax=Methylobacterium phyllostachyos TaxID=582672 RepID=A0A1G9Y4K0_9HYPH|nr:hypothetical protein [Methylobacterium phyllostachyos]SDN03395.1 hypothetical protein SAMN05216360_105147 [Methylobacterium phyllostachyos]
MTAIRTIIAASLLSAWPFGVVFAQTDQMGTDSGTSPAATLPDPVTVEKTKPPIRDASPASVKPGERPTPEQVSNDTIVDKVCVGCRAEPATADPLSLRIRPSGPPERRDGQLDARGGRRDARSTVGEPRQQPDLDTVALASAHRERAESVDEKTTGLWQSWVVSVCDGCGDQKPAKALKLEDWPYRTSPVTTGSVLHKALPVAARADAKPSAPHPHGTLEADLSPENVDSIRRMPQH